MPNNITTQVRISGSKAKIKSLIKRTKIQLDDSVDENQFDFNGIIKMPKALNISSGSDMSLGLVAWKDSEEDISSAVSSTFASIDFYRTMPWWEDRYPGVKTELQLRKALKEKNPKAYELGKKGIQNIRKYGYPTWYEWSYANWSTKWNSYNVNYVTHTDTTLVVSLDTAWGTPHKIWEALIAEGFEVDGVIYGEMDGYEYLNDGSNYFDAYQNVEVEYLG